MKSHLGQWTCGALLLVAGAWLCAAGVPRAASEPTEDLAARILASAKANKGFCVHLGVSDGTLTGALAGKDAFLVHGLASDEATVRRARAHLQAAGMYGRVSVERGSLERLPYADDLANLIVVDDLPAAQKAGLSLTETLRVLAPNGVAWIGCRQGLTAEALKRTLTEAKVAEFTIVEVGGVWARVTKKRPQGYGEWTHHDCDPGHNRVSQDTFVEPTQRLHWIAGKPWPSEDYGAFGMRSAGDRVFYAYNESPHRGAGWPYLTARDAYSGVLLWRRLVPGYIEHATIATQDRLYTAFGSDGVLVALDARTGQEVQTYKEGGRVSWAVLHDGRLLVSSDPGRLRCLDAQSGKKNWTSEKWGVNRRPEIAIDGDRIYVKEFRKNELGCLDLSDGKAIWSVDYSKHLSDPKLESGLCAYSNGVMVIGESGGRADLSGKGVHAFSTQNGRHLWSHNYELLGVPWRRKAKSYMDGLFLDGLFWVHVGEVAGGGKIQRESDPRNFYWQGLDPKTGKPMKRFDYPQGVGGGASCYPDQATVRYFMGGYTDFLDTATGRYQPRATGLHASCGFGALPANGRQG